jgi:site-specific recombinase XerD
MKAKFKAVLFSKPYSNGEYPIFIRVYFRGKSSYLSAGYSIPSGAWDNNSSLLWESMPGLTKRMKESLSKEEIKAFRQKQKGIIILPNAAKINSDIRALIGRLEGIQAKLKANEEPISTEILKSRAENRDKFDNSQKDFLSYIQEIANKKFQKGQIRTSEKYIVLLKKLKAFRKGKPLPIEEISTSLLNEFQLYLQKEGSHQNYIHVNLKALRTIIQKEAIREDKIIPIEKNPFTFFTMPKVLPTSKERLDIREIERIEALNLPESEIHFHIRNAFLFSFYCVGIRIGDLLQLKWTNIKEGRLVYSMGKTGKQQNIKLLTQALKILEYYRIRKNNDSDYIFPFLDNGAAYAKLISPEEFQKAKPELLSLLYKKIESRIVVFNAGLKMIAVKARIKKRISSHVARHSFADIARKKGISVYDISAMLKHSSIKITQAYLESLDIESMDNAMEKVFK